ncbi:alanine--tRNA ligase-related protein [Legionella fallonii]|uniref:Alanine--tRNA ligase n=1 Tax=Legionella fallonii LLAP-10 TaxID=1212491 RepID=A0A098G3Q2_9GAMM|nr:alanine--tRNA ligase-related protein [Legionella fallonii]CEG56601.1 putative Predicted metal-dependent hydrolases [Legionella fallonii LLAP-10]
MKTILYYLKNPGLTEYAAQYQNHGIDELGAYITLDSTIFYPQGGGQPADQGTMIINDQIIEIHHVRTINNEVRHYTKQPYSFNYGETVFSKIDTSKRWLHTRLHTAGHLLSNIMEKIHPEWMAIKGHHFPGEAYVEFKSKQSTNAIDLEELNQKINHIIKSAPSLDTLFISGKELQQYCPNLPYAIPEEEQIRLIKIGDHPFQPCGGTHVSQLNELKEVQLIKAKIKQDRLKISYHLA